MLVVEKRVFAIVQFHLLQDFILTFLKSFCKNVFNTLDGEYITVHFSNIPCISEWSLLGACIFNE